MRDLSLENPIRSIREVSHDLTGRRRLRLASGREMSALEIQEAYLERVERFVEANDPDPEAKEVVERWKEILEQLADDPFELDRELDWVSKYHLVEAYRNRHDLPLAHARVAMIDLAYHNVARERGLFYVLQRRGSAKRLFDDEDIDAAKTQPPERTRAALRGRFIRHAKARRRDYTVDWVHLKLNDQAQRTVLCKDPFRYQDDRVDKLIASM